jgi:sn-glycerol 3-phosphate transport system substrate-binding protein
MLRLCVFARDFDFHMQKKRFVLLSALLALGLALAACAPAAPRPVLVMWHALDGVRERALLKLVDQWNGANSAGVVIVPEKKSSANLHSAMQAGIRNGTLPAMALVTPSQAALYEQLNGLTQLDAFADNADAGWNANDRADLYPFVLNAGRTPQGRLVGVPMGGSARFMIANRDWLGNMNQQSAPVEWAQFDKNCNSATDRFAGTLCFGIVLNRVLFEEWTAAKGAPVYSAQTQSLQIASPATASAIENLVTYLQNGIAYRVPTAQRAIDDFAAARVLLANDWSYRLNLYADTIPDRANFAYDVSTLPANAGAKPVSMFVAPLWVLPRGNADRARAGWQFIKWITDAPQTAQWASETNELPARASVINTLNLDPAQPLDAGRAALLQQIAPNAVASPLYAGWPCVQEELQNALRQIFDNQPITETLTLAQSRAQDVLSVDCSNR